MAKKNIKSKGKDKNYSRERVTPKPGKFSWPGFDQLKKDQVFVSRAILYLMLIILALILLISPFYRGLFFTHELLVANAVIFGLLFIWGIFRILNKDGRFINSPLDICLAILFIAYLVSFFGFAVHKRDALEEVLKIASYIVIYLVAADICRYLPQPFRKDQEKEEGIESGDIPPGLNILLHLLMFVAIVVTIASLGAAAGHWDFVGAYASNRIASPMGYANTAAAYLMAAYFLTIALSPLSDKWLRVLYLAPASLMLLTVILTFSRGAWLMLIPLVLLMIIVSAPGNRLRVALSVFATAIPAIPIALLVDPLFRSGQPVLAWISIFVVIILAVALGYLFELYFSRSRKVKINLAIAASIILITVFIILFIIPIYSPLTLSNKSSKQEQYQAFRQVIEDVRQDQSYQLSMLINAEQGLSPGDSEPEYIWGLTVLGGVPGYRNVNLLDYQGLTTDGWEEFNFDFKTGEETTRLEILLYNYYPGTMFTARDVKLLSADQETTLRFAWNRILPERFYERIFSYSRDRNVDRRFELFRDATKVIKDNPVFGIGGGGWEAVYRSYQDQPYNSNEVHNHYIQVWIEAGILGFLAFTGLWISFALAFYRNCFKGQASRREWQYWAAAFIPAAALGAHSLIDWNFSMAAVGIFLFVLLGAGRSLDKMSWLHKEAKLDKPEGNRSIIIGSGGVVLGFALTIYAIILYNGLQTTWRSQELFERGNIKQAMFEMERAIAMDPLLAENYHNLNVYLEEQALRSQSQSELERVVALAERANELEPYNPSYLIRYGNLLLSYVDIREGLEKIDKLSKLRPFAESSYLQAAWARLSLVEFYTENNSVSNAIIYYNELFELESKMNEQIDNTNHLAYVIGRAAFRMGDFTVAQKYLQQVSNDDPMYEDALLLLQELQNNNETGE